MKIETKITLTEKEITNIIYEAIKNMGRLPITTSLKYDVRTKTDPDGYQSCVFNGAELYVESK